MPLPPIPLQTVAFWHESFFRNVKSGALPQRTLWNIANVLRLPLLRNMLCLIKTFARNLLFWHIRLKHCAKFNCLWKSLSASWCPTRIWSEYHFNSLQVMRLNDDADRPSPFCCALTFALFSNNVRSHSTFFYQFLQIDFSQNFFCFCSDLSKLRYFATLFWKDVL